MEYKELLHFLQHVGTDPSRLIFEDELTGIYNRRFLLNYFRYKVPWDSLEIRPLSLLMMDLDRFKEINDNYGHDAGDQVLIWVASLIKEVSGDQGLAIRYAGDEFIILLPNGEKKLALKVAEELLQRLHKEVLRLPEVDEELRVTLSIGVASAPDDAYTGKALIQKADTALYYAKKTGRDRVANAKEIAPEEVFTKTALYQLDKARIAGRKNQLAKVAEALRKFSKRESQFLIVEGASGMGKSEFIQTVRRNLAQTKIWQITAKGLPQEGFRPYYLTTTILIEIINQRPDKGAGILDHLSPQEANHLSHILPQLGEPEEEADQKDEKTQREIIFTTLVHLIPKLINSRPFILFIDDIHLSDEATLLLLRNLLLRKDFPLFILGTAMDLLPGIGEGQQTPLQRFLTAYEQELAIDNVSLTPLTASEIGAHFRGIFPQVSLPKDFEKSLTQITHGNPLFLSEIQRKLVLEGKLTLTGQQWVIEPLDEGYLPKSLEEIVSQKIVALDKESKELLDQASTFGENVSLSLLTGSSENRETQVLEFVDQAVAQGLISIDYQMNDDTIRFLGKRVLEITYGAIDEDRKRELHERIGDYQETLYEQKLLPSAATLAYHFQRSANQEKARLYLESQRTLNNKIYNSAEAVTYTGEKLEDTVPEDTPLDPTSLSDIPGVIRALLTTVRNIKLYPPGSKAIVTSTEQLREVIDKILTNNERLNITVVENDLMVNGETLDIEEFNSIAEAFMKLLNQVELRGIALSRGLAGHELRAMVEGLGRSTKKMIDRRFWKRFAAKQRLYHIDLKQVRYTTMAGPDDAPEDRGAGKPESSDTPGYDGAQILGVDQPLDDHEVNQIPDVLRCLLTASSNIKLYPPESAAIRYSIEQLYRALKGFLSNRPALTLARVGESLLINGQKIDTDDFKTMADGFLRFLESINLRSLSFLRDISVRELLALLLAFISAADQSTADSFDTFFWRRLAREQQLFTILFDQRLYGILGERVGIGADHLEKAEEISEEDDLGPGQVVVPGVPSEVAPTLSGVLPGDYTLQESTIPEPSEFRLTDRSVDTMAEKLSDTLLKGDEKQTLQIMHQLFQDFASQGNFIRTKVINMCENFLEDPVYGSQPTSVEFFIDPLLRVFPQEEDLGLARQIGALLSQAAANLIQFGDYQMASRILTHLRSRQNQVQAKRETLSDETILLRELDPKKDSDDSSGGFAIKRPRSAPEGYPTFEHLGSSGYPPAR